MDFFISVPSTGDLGWLGYRWGNPILLGTRFQGESCTENSYFVFGVESSIARREGGCKVSGRLVILSSVIAFTLFGVLITFTYLPRTELAGQRSCIGFGAV